VTVTPTGAAEGIDGDRLTAIVAFSDWAAKINIPLRKRLFIVC
jgi:hypothetical protein